MEFLEKSLRLHQVFGNCFPCIFFQAWYFHQQVHYYVGSHDFIRRNRVCNVICLKVSYTNINNYGITYIKLHETRDFFYSIITFSYTKYFVHSYTVDLVFTLSYWSEFEQYLLVPVLSSIAKDIVLISTTHATDCIVNAGQS